MHRVQSFDRPYNRALCLIWCYRLFSPNLLPPTREVIHKSDTSKIGGRWWWVVLSSIRWVKTRNCLSCGNVMPFQSTLHCNDSKLLSEIWHTGVCRDDRAPGGFCVETEMFSPLHEGVAYFNYFGIVHCKLAGWDQEKGWFLLLFAQSTVAIQRRLLAVACTWLSYIIPNVLFLGCRMCEPTPANSGERGLRPRLGMESRTKIHTSAILILPVFVQCYRFFSYFSSHG